MPDIDLDFFDRDSVLEKFKHIKGSRLEKDELKKHNTGVYFHNAPIDRCVPLGSSRAST